MNEIQQKIVKYLGEFGIKSRLFNDIWKYIPIEKDYILRKHLNMLIRKSFVKRIRHSEPNKIVNRYHLTRGGLSLLNKWKSEGKL